MNRIITRGLALATVTGALTFFGATAANAIDIDGGDGLLSDLSVPVSVDGLNVNVLGGENGIGSLGNGILADTGSTTAYLGIDTTDLLGDTDALTAVVGVPLDVSNTWVSILGNEPNGIVVVPTLATEPTAAVAGLLDAFVDVPVDVSCSSVTVLSDYTNECASAGSDGDLAADVPVTLDDQQIDVLDGDILDGVLEDDGVDVGLGDSVVDPGTGLGLGLDFVDAVIGAPIDLSEVWVSAFGENGGVVVVPDLTIDASVLTGGFITSELLAPIAIDCVTVTALSDYERDCGASSSDGDPVIPVTAAEPAAPTASAAVDGTDIGGSTGTDEGDAIDPCTVVPTSVTTGLNAASTSDANLGMLAMGALAGGLAAMGLIAFGRKLGAKQ